MSEAPSETRGYPLTTRNLFQHFLLLHDFLYNFSKTQARNQYHLDTQLDVSKIMNNATLSGSKCGQFSSFAMFMLYCFKSRNIPMKFATGFLYVYWMNHFATLGSYAGALVRIPAAYQKVGQYFTNYEPSPNALDTFSEIMEVEHQYEDTHELLAKVFPEQHKTSGSTFTKNDYFITNKDKYDFESHVEKNSLKLTYFDSFLTRYAYHSFTRWLFRVKLFIGLEKE